MKMIDHQLKTTIGRELDCVQGGAVNLLGFYGVETSVNEIRTSVDLYTDKEGNVLGSSLGHMGKYFVDLGFEVTLHMSDVEIFDIGWSTKSNDEIVDLLKRRKKYLRHGKYDQEALEYIVSGYQEFLKAGGMLVFPQVSVEYLYGLLEKGPVYLVVSYQMLNRCSKYRYDDELGKPVEDSVKGVSATHVVVVSGYDEGKFKIVDSDVVHGGERWVESDWLVSCHYGAMGDMDSVMFSIKK